ncbi:MAG: response regulator [Desulfatiglandaceae bacterium]
MAINPEKKQAYTILIAEDDPDDRLIIKAAFDAGGISHLVRFVNDGEELMDYLTEREHSLKQLPRHILVLDLNMPRKDGRKALREIRQNPHLDHLQVVVLTTSGAQQDRDYCSRLGISNYMVKPSDFDGFLHFVKIIAQICECV